MRNVHTDQLKKRKRKKNGQKVSVVRWSYLHSKVSEGGKNGQMETLFSRSSKHHFRAEWDTYESKKETHGKLALQGLFQTGKVVQRDIDKELDSQNISYIPKSLVKLFSLKKGYDEYPAVTCVKSYVREAKEEMFESLFKTTNQVFPVDGYHECFEEN